MDKQNFKKVAAIVAIAGAAMSTSVVSSAEGRTVEQIYKECGIGAMVFRDSPILAVISNVTFDWGTTAAISNSMSPETCNGSTVRSAMLIKEAFPSLEKDLAVGSGDHLQALTTLMDCPAAASAVRGDYAKYANSLSYHNGDRNDHAESLFAIVNKNKQTHDCQS